VLQLWPLHKAVTELVSSAHVCDVSKCPEPCRRKRCEPRLLDCDAPIAAARGAWEKAAPWMHTNLADWWAFRVRYSVLSTGPLRLRHAQALL
jgi:hypothetical protein